MAAAKIDLKARLGKKPGAPAGAGAVGPVQPGPAVTPGSVPPGYGSVPPGVAAPVAPAAGFGSAPTQPRPQQPVAARGPVAGARPAGFGGPGGISVPPPPGFGPKPTPVEAKPQAAPQLAIKMEMGEEVVQAQKAFKKKTAILAAVAAVVGLVIGYGVGQLAKGAEGAQAAVEGAGLLVKEIDEANVALHKIEEILQSAGVKLQGGEFPEKEIEELGGITVPFDGSNLTNKGIGRFNPTAVTMLVSYTNAVAEVEEQKDKIRRQFSIAKDTFKAQAEEKTAPKVHWGVALKGGPGGPWGQMTRINSFDVADKDKKAWPDQVEIGDKKVARFKGGDVSKADGEILPVDPGTEIQVCPENLNLRLMGVLGELRSKLKGDDTPGRERAGIVEQGQKLLEQLRKIGTPG